MHELQQDPLQVLSDQFLTFRGDRFRCTFPEAFWREAFSLSKSYSVLQIAHAIRVHPAFVQRKFKNFAQTSPSEKPEFVQIKLQTFSQATSTYLDFKTVAGRPISIRFQANVSELFPLIQALTGIQT